MEENISAKIKGFVTVKQEDEVIIDGQENNIVNNFAEHMVGCHVLDSYGDSCNVCLGDGSIDINFMHLGEDTTTVTSGGMDTLVNPIGSGNGTDSNVQSGTYRGEVNGGVEWLYSSTWDAGTISGTVGEIGLFLYAIDNTNVGAYEWEQVFQRNL